MIKNNILWNYRTRIKNILYLSKSEQIQLKHSNYGYINLGDARNMDESEIFTKADLEYINNTFTKADLKYINKNKYANTRYKTILNDKKGNI